jgi:hypothetical protein
LGLPGDEERAHVADWKIFLAGGVVDAASGPAEILGDLVGTVSKSLLAEAASVIVHLHSQSSAWRLLGLMMQVLREPSLLA